MSSMLGLKGALALSETEIVRVWIPAFAKYPKYKLVAMASDYRTDERGFGRTLADILRWLDNYQEPVRHAQVTTPRLEHIPAREKAMVDMVEHHRRVYASTGSSTPHSLSEHEVKWKVELDGLKELAEKHPHCGFDKAFRERSRQIIDKRAWLKENGR